MKWMNPSVLPLLAREKAGENEIFARKLKKLPGTEVDRLFHSAYATIAPQVDCTVCGNCCKKLEPLLEEKDIRHFAAHLQMDPAAFREKWLAEDRNGHFFSRAKPCVCLHDNRCGIYADRPEPCADYPHLSQPHLKWKLKTIFKNYEICPIVFHVIEKLKTSG